MHAPTSTVSMSAAIRAAMSAVSIHRSSRTSYLIIGPYHANDISGPSTESSADSYRKAVLHAAAWKATIALALMGRLDEDTSYRVEKMVHDQHEAHDVRSLVAYAVAKARG